MKTKTDLLHQLLKDEAQVKALNILFDAAHCTNYDDLDLRFSFPREVDHIRKVLQIGRYAPKDESAGS